MNKLIPNQTYRTVINFAISLTTLGLALSWCIEMVMREMFRLALI